MAQGKAERCINPSEERFLGSQQRHKCEVLKGGYETENLSRIKKEMDDRPLTVLISEVTIGWEKLAGATGFEPVLPP